MEPPKKMSLAEELALLEEGRNLKYKTYRPDIATRTRAKFNKLQRAFMSVFEQSMTSNNKTHSSQPIEYSAMDEDFFKQINSVTSIPENLNDVKKLPIDDFVGWSRFDPQRDGLFSRSWHLR